MNTSLKIEKCFIECSVLMINFTAKFDELQTLVHQYKEESDTE